MITIEKTSNYEKYYEGHEKCEPTPYPYTGYQASPDDAILDLIKRAALLMLYPKSKEARPVETKRIDITFEDNILTIADSAACMTEKELFEMVRHNEFEFSNDFSHFWLPTYTLRALNPENNDWFILSRCCDSRTCYLVKAPYSYITTVTPVSTYYIPKDINTVFRIAVTRPFKDDKFFDKLWIACHGFIELGITISYNGKNLHDFSKYFKVLSTQDLKIENPQYWCRVVQYFLKEQDSDSMPPSADICGCYVYANDILGKRCGFDFVPREAITNVKDMRKRFGDREYLNLEDCKVFPFLKRMVTTIHICFNDKRYPPHVVSDITNRPEGKEIMELVSEAITPIYSNEYSKYLKDSEMVEDLVRKHIYRLNNEACLLFSRNVHLKGFDPLDCMVFVSKDESEKFSVVYASDLQSNMDRLNTLSQFEITAESVSDLTPIAFVQIARDNRLIKTVDVRQLIDFAAEYERVTHKKAPILYIFGHGVNDDVVSFIRSEKFNDVDIKIVIY